MKYVHSFYNSWRINVYNRNKHMSEKIWWQMDQIASIYKEKMEKKLLLHSQMWSISAAKKEFWIILNTSRSIHQGICTHITWFVWYLWLARHSQFRLVMTTWYIIVHMPFEYSKSMLCLKTFYRKLNYDTE